MTQEAWCLAHNADVPIDVRRRCIVHDTLTIPPSWSRKDTSYPYPERPEGYVYAAPVFPGPKASTKAVGARTEPVVSVSAATACGHCGETVSRVQDGGSRQRYCNEVCKRRAASARRRKQPTEAVCRSCGGVLSLIARGGRRRYCSKTCKHRAHESERPVRVRDRRVA